MYELDNRNLNWSYADRIGDDYYIFILGYDILSWKFRERDLSCDDAFELACKIWKRFKEWEKMFGAKDRSIYDELWDYADKYIDKIVLEKEN